MRHILAEMTLMRGSKLSGVRGRRTKPAVTRGHGSRRLCNASDTLTDFGERGKYALFQEKCMRIVVLGLLDQ